MQEQMQFICNSISIKLVKNNKEIKFLLKYAKYRTTSIISSKIIIH